MFFKIEGYIKRKSSERTMADQVSSTSAIPDNMNGGNSISQEGGGTSAAYATSSSRNASLAAASTTTGSSAAAATATTAGAAALPSSSSNDQQQQNQHHQQSSNSSNNNNNNISYSAERIIGNGSFGVVFEAKVVETGEVVAIKKVLQDKRFKNRELQIMRQLVKDPHPNIVALKHCFYSQVSKTNFFVGFPENVVCCLNLVSSIYT